MERKLISGPGLRSFFFPMAPLNSRRGIALLTLASLRALMVLLRHRPRVTLATGGYVCVPAATAACLLRVPLVLFLPDVVPGRAVSWLVPFARRIAVSTEATAQHLPADKVVVTGYPIRDAFRTTSREAARSRLNLPRDATVLGVFGGSQGARSINEVVASLLPDLLARYHVLHVCGQQRLAEATKAAADLPADLRTRYHLYPYLDSDDMAAALAASDLVVCRSGASVLGELPATGTPAVLVPYPVPAVHQRENAEYLASRGAATVVDDADVAHSLGPTVISLLDDPARLKNMAAASTALARPNAAAAIVDLLERTAA